MTPAARAARAEPGSLPVRPFSVIDEMTCYFDTASEPANIHLEMRVPFRLDHPAFREAALAALAANPRACSRRARRSPLRRRYVWERPSAFDVDPVSFTNYADAVELAARRAIFIGRSPSIEASPPAAILVASGPDCDYVILNAHHATMDGMSWLELLRDIARRYRAGGADGSGRANSTDGADGSCHAGGADGTDGAGRADATDDTDGADGRDGADGGDGADGWDGAGRTDGAGRADGTERAGRTGGTDGTGRTGGQRSGQTSTGPRGEPASRPARAGSAGSAGPAGPAAAANPPVYAWSGSRRPRRPARLAADGGGDRGTGTCLVLLPGIPALRPTTVGPSPTVNDALVTALVVAVGRWNAGHGSRARPVRITVPVNARAAGERAAGHLSRLVTISARPPAPGDDLSPVLFDVARQTRAARDQPGNLVGRGNRVMASVWCPAPVKRWLLRAALRTVGPLVCDTAMLTNLGNVTDPPDFGGPDPVTMAFSGTAQMPRGMSVAAITAGSRLQLSVRYNRRLLSDDAAARFTDVYLRALAELTDSRPSATADAARTSMETRWR